MSWVVFETERKYRRENTALLNIILKISMKSSVAAVKAARDNLFASRKNCEFKFVYYGCDLLGREIGECMLNLIPSKVRLGFNKILKLQLYYQR